MYGVFHQPCSSSIHSLSAAEAAHQLVVQPVDYRGWQTGDAVHHLPLGLVQHVRAFAIELEDPGTTCRLYADVGRQGEVGASSAVPPALLNSSSGSLYQNLHMALEKYFPLVKAWFKTM